MPERAPLEAVVFDAGGTLVRLDFEWMAVAVTALGSALEPARLRRAEVEGRRRYDACFEGGPGPGGGPEPAGWARDSRAYFGGMLEAAGVPARLVEPALRLFRERHQAHGLWSRPMEGARAALDRLARTTLRLAAVSNSDGRAEDHLRHAGVLEGLEFVVDSHHAAVEKPDPAIFRVALERLGVAAPRALYVGDIRAVDEAGARAAGMRFVLIDPWGDYGAPGADSVRGPAELPDWIAAHHDLPAPDGAGEPRT